MTTRDTLTTLATGGRLDRIPLGTMPGEIYQRLGQIMAEVPAIPKGQENQQQRYAFRGIDDVFNALHGLFAKHGVVILPEVLKAEYVQQLAGSNQNLATDARLLVRYHFVAGDGSSVSMTCQGESRDYADKATGQALSAAIKGGLLQMFLIPLEGMPEQDSQSPTIEDPLTPEELEVRAEVSVKNQLVVILGTNNAAASFWDTHQGMSHEEMVKAAIQKVADDTEAGDATPEPEIEETPAVEETAEGKDPGDDEGPERGSEESFQGLLLGKVPARKTLLQQGITDMAILGGREVWLENQIIAAEKKALSGLAVADLKVLYAALQKELTSG